jgi:very-short-patch-repair endonuclease
VRLRELRELGFHIRRQSPIARYIVDFEGRRRRLVVEADGVEYGFDRGRTQDFIRDQTLKQWVTACFALLTRTSSEIWTVFWR